ncbi:unnamed protein product [Strongylus vulgaris]|uniref:Uncharacterized protein n=1 Tax=Strongylus vulgaris TaxID=40348 RepID=A0A3P7JLJ7_STRVU|nr:unnamed protein product [Strongylus vulgaris]
MIDCLVREKDRDYCYQQVGNRSDSNVYIGAKIRKAAEIGAEGRLVKLPDTLTQSELEEEIAKLNADDDVDGIIVQLPLDCKNHIDADAVIDKIHPLKDVDGLTRENAGRLMRGELQRTIIPCTPNGCLYLVQKATAVVIDCGINVEPATEPGKKNKLYGDVDFEAAKEVAGYITPVPGGVGPMTVAMLIRNTFQQALHQAKNNLFRDFVCLLSFACS